MIYGALFGTISICGHIGPIIAAVQAQIELIALSCDGGPIALANIILILFLALLEDAKFGAHHSELPLVVLAGASRIRIL